MELISRLQDKLGPVLFQLPPSLSLSLESLDHWLQTIRQQCQQSNHRVVLEVRHPSWLVPDVVQRLQDANVALCLADGAYLSVIDLLTADFVYVRRHGTVPNIGYATESLQADAQQIMEWKKGDRDVYVYFNNDAQGYAIQDAQQLRVEIANAKKIVGDQHSGDEDHL